MITFSIFGTPVAKGRPRFARRKNFVTVITPDKTRQFEHALVSQALQYKPLAPLDIPLRVELSFWFPAAQQTVKQAAREKKKVEDYPHLTKPDIDNLIKSALDPLNSIFWVDDKVIVEVLARKGYSSNPRIDYKIGKL